MIGTVGLSSNDLPAATASVTAYSEAISLGRGWEAANGFEVWFTSYDASSQIPLYDLRPGGYAYFSQEFRPRAIGSTTWDTDYIAFDGFGPIEWGVVTVTIPTVDADSNGHPDVAQINRGTNLNISGTSTAHGPGTPITSPVSVRLLRSAGSAVGTYTTTVFSPFGTLYYTGNYAVLSATGQATYTRATRAIQFDVAVYDPSSQTTVTMSGGTTYSISGSSMVLPAFNLVDDLGQTHTLKAVTLPRVGTSKTFRARMEFVDGTPATSWPDYRWWTLEITDPNDSDGNGLPDLVDTFVAPPVVVTSPMGGNFAVASSVVLSVSASGTGLTYQWWLDGAVVPGAQSASLIVPTHTPFLDRDYYVRVSNSGGFVNSAVARVSLLAPVQWTVLPQTTVVAVGSPLMLTGAASGTALSYEWRRDGQVLSGGPHGPTWQAATAQPSMRGSYTLTVSNRLGALTSAAVAVQVLHPPQLQSAFTDQQRAVGQGLNLQLVATGDDLSFEWWKGETRVVSGPGLQWAEVTFAEEGWYRGVAYNAVGRVETALIHLDVIPAGPPAWWLERGGDGLLLRARNLDPGRTHRVEQTSTPSLGGSWQAANPSTLSPDARGQIEQPVPLSGAQQFWRLHSGL